MNQQNKDGRSPVEQREERSLTHDAFVAVSEGFGLGAGGVSAKVVMEAVADQIGQHLGQGQKPETQKIELPPGVERE